jgi:hypothetical protein
MNSNTSSFWLNGGDFQDFRSKRTLPSRCFAVA